MKVLVVTPYYYPKIGGLEIYARSLGLALRDIKKWEVVVVTSNHEGHKPEVGTVDGMRIYRLGAWFKLSNTPVNLFWPLYIRKIIRQEKPDLILAHSPVPSMADAAALAAGRTPFFLVYHASTLLKGSSPLFKLAAYAYGQYQRLTFSRANKILAVSGYVKECLGPKLATKTEVLPNAVWERDITSRTQPTTTNFLFVGSLDKTHFWKGLDQIIEAIASYKLLYGKSVKLTIMGDGNNRAHYQALVDELRLGSQVTFLGAQIGSKKDQAFRHATALVLYPTTANDAFPTVMLEAWAREVPVIGAAIGPIPSLLTDGKDGYLVPSHNPEALAATLHAVATSDTAQRSVIAAAAARRLRSSYTWERQAAAVSKIAKELL